MPVPRLFEAASDSREQWSHVLASLLALTGPATRAALTAELAGEELPGAEAAQVRERARLGEVPVDLVVADPGAAVDPRDRVRAWPSTTTWPCASAWPTTPLPRGRSAPSSVALTPDRRPPDAVAAGADGGRDVRHRSWLRIGTGCRSGPSAGSAEGVDLVLLREAEYFLTPRVAELYRLEGVMPNLPRAVRPALAAAFFDLNELAPAPLIVTGAGGESARIAFPRTGEARAELGVEAGALRLGLAAPPPALRASRRRPTRAGACSRSCGRPTTARPAAGSRTPRGSSSSDPGSRHRPPPARGDGG